MYITIHMYISALQKEETKKKVRKTVNIQTRDLAKKSRKSKKEHFKLNLHLVGFHIVSIFATTNPSIHGSNISRKRRSRR